MAVFLNFCDEDTGKSFVAHLNNALTESGISTFFFSQRGQGEEEMERAIRECEVLIAVFSTNYASSSLCLNQLSYLMSLPATSMKSILPVFYDVEPFHVRRQEGPFKGALEFHKKKNGSDEEIILNWRNAFQQVADLFCWDMQNHSYASFSFPLDQLSYFLNLPPKWGRRSIFPVFFYVEPSRFCRQQRPFSGAFEFHKKKTEIGEETVQNWRNALKEVGGLCGWDMKNCRNEANLVQELVEHASAKLENTTSWHVADHPIGLDSRVDDVMTLLDVDAADVRMIGIHGMGGIGKTTLAKAVFNKIYASFDAKCFLSDIREVSRTCGGLVTLQKHLLKELFSDEGRNIYDVDRGINVIKKRIGSKKVLVVFDDIDDEIQLEKLAGNHHWYCQGSRIIITTRDEHVLNVHKRVENNHIYKLEGLADTQSLELFSWCAFQRNQPMQEYVQLSRDVVSTAGGLPLALEVLGYYLCDKTIEEWKDAITKLKRIPEDKVLLKLKISFDDLSEETKQIFLDIACFFIGQDKDYTIYIWKGSGFPALNSIRKLLQRALIKITNENCLWMHDQLRDVGRRIVELENLGDPGRCSRLWSREDVIDVLKNHKGTREVRGLMLKGNEREENWETEAFKPMTNLKLLNISDVSLKGSFKSLSSELVWLKWLRCPLKYVPDDFSYEKLAVLDLSDSEAVWNLLNNNIKQIFPKLKVLILRGCHNLERIPNCSLYPNLETLNLEQCCNLVEIPNSIGLLRNLVYLNLCECSSLKEVPDSLGSLENLKELDVGQCEELSRFPTSIGRMRSLRYLYMKNTALATLPDDFGRLSKLEELTMNWCKQLKELPESFGNLTSLRALNISNSTSLTRLPSTFSSLCSLEKLNAEDCNLQGMIPDDFEKLSSLRILNLTRNKVQGLPSSMRCLSHLEELYINGCEQLVAIPELPTSLKHLDASGCKSLQMITKLSHLYHLETLCIYDCEQLVAIPELPHSLKEFKARGCSSLQTMPKLFHLSKLKELDVNDCKKLSAIEDIPTNLELLFASNCISLQIIPNLFHLSQLKHLDLTNCEKVIEIQGLNGLKSLRELFLSGCSPHTLRGQSLAKETFTSLDKLSIPGSKVPDWFMFQTPSFTVPRLSDVGLHIREVLLCFSYSTYDTSPGSPRSMVSIKREDRGIRIEEQVDIQYFPLSHQNQVFFRRLRHGHMPRLWFKWFKDENQIELLTKFMVCLKGAMHLVYKPADTDESIQERLANFFNPLLSE
ncbi:TMV resistance protein N [Amborella trichopoda]|uniref:TIR domain-containing protein n=1 Tax=Amborella trichopoda TaxID=13333 RepID=W1NN18_AMBTC|nr:TMV resistance protein N [Amborella trichopoda]ERM96709.1 hypothetical protein AMTR_s00001p00273020 [Amborella trichopoda]|eukprot:XP_006829293.1 TMV resistance protein N [Amborella trichopoda]